MLIRIAFLIAALLPATLAAADRDPSSDPWGAKTSLRFEPNRGQTSSSVRFLTRTGHGVVLFTRNAVVLPGAERYSGFQLGGEDAKANWEALEPTGHTTSYYIGSDPALWAEHVPDFGRLMRRNVYPGIDLVFYGRSNRLEYDFQLAPHADPKRIRLRFTGARRISIASDGSLVLDTADGPVRHLKPALFETLADGSKRSVEGEYRLLGPSEAGFRVGKHDSSLALSIDPVLEYSSYFGGSGDDSIIASNQFVTVGNTTSIDFPGAAFARRHGTNVFVVEFGATLVYGGTGDMVATSAAPATSFGGAPTVVGGYTNAPDLPTGLVSSNSPLLNVAWQTNYAGGATDGFLLLLAAPSDSIVSGPNTGRLLSYIGTPGDDSVTAVAANGNSFVLAGTTTGRGLPASSTPVYLGVSPDSASGLDGFYLAGFDGDLGILTPTLSSTGYFGGSGDDTPLAALIATTGYYIAGETTSADFPAANGLPSALNGGSDAFLLCAPTTAASPTFPAILFGGSGTDRAVQLSALNDGTVLMAGTTSSTDLPLQNPAQATYGGGASDAFLAMFTADLTTLKYATYIGGSGADQASSVVNDGTAHIFVGGWTASPDFPLQNPLQSNFGGGPDDGFLADYNLSGNLIDSTYFGGSGSDHILGLYAPGGSTVVASGQTTSADLPLMGAGQVALSGPSDGFTARISSTAIEGPPVSGAKDLRSLAEFTLGNALLAATAAVTVTTSDPSTVQLAANSGDFGQTSIAVTTQYLAIYRAVFYVDCLQDHGVANLTISATGYPDLIVPVTCYPAALELISSNLLLKPNGGPTDLPVALVVNAPGQALSNSVIGSRPGAAPIQVQAVTSNPAVGSLSPASLSLTGALGAFSFTPSALGQTQISFSAGLSFVGSNTVNITVAALFLPTTTFTAPSGYQGEMQFAYNLPDPTQATTVTVTSQDPGSVALSLDPTQPGTGSVTLAVGSSNTRTVWIQALAQAGDIGLTLTAPGLDPVQATVHITTPTVWFGYGALITQPAVLAVGQSLNLSAEIGGADPQPSCCYVPNPGSSLPLSLTAGNPAIATIVAKPPALAPPNNSVTFQVTGAAPGSTPLNLQLPPGIPAAANFRNITLSVSQPTLVLPDLELGQNLQANMTLRFPTAAAGTSVHLAIDNPSLALFLPTGQTQGQAQMDMAVATGVTAASFYVYGLAGSGTAHITATIAGVGSVTANLILEPSGFGWSADNISGVLYTGLSAPSVVAFVLDPATMLPVGQQFLAPGVTASVPISSSNTAVLSLNSTTVTVPSGIQTASPAITVKAAGTTVLAITQPPGFRTPSIRQQLPVTIQTPTLGIAAQSLGNNLQQPLVFGNIPNNLDLPLTVTSSDPSRLLISTDPAQPGTASATVGLSGRGQLTIQALADNGQATISASMPTFNSTTVTVTLLPTAIGLRALNASASSVTTTTESPNTILLPEILTLYPSGPSPASASFRAGLGPVEATVTSSNTAVGAITGSPITLNASVYMLPTIDFTPIAIGDANVTISQPAGFAAVPEFSTVAFQVTAPSFAPLGLALGKDTFVADSIGLAQNESAPVDVPVTVTSSDPSRILLSPDAATAPSPSISQTLLANRMSFGPFYIHAIGNSGTVPIAITAPGWTASNLNINLSDTTFAFNASSSLQTGLQSGQQSVSVVATLAPVNGYPFASTIRPGAAPITIQVASSDPTIIAVDTPQIVFQPGSSIVPVKFHALQPGTASLTLTVPSGYASPGAYGVLNVTVVPGP